MYQSAILLLILTFSSSIWAIDTRELFTTPVISKFRAVEDSLCFRNYIGFKEAAGKNPYLNGLAAVGSKEGVCQGMVGVAAAVKTRVVFRPDKKKMSKSKIRKQIRRSVDLHKNNCSGKIFIDGHRNLRELCEDSKYNEFGLRRRSLSYNLSLAITEILPVSRTFFFDEPLSSDANSSKHLLKQLKSFYSALLKGEYPLMLVRKHVTLVTGMSVDRDAEGYIYKVTINHYDPNIVMSSARDIYERTYYFSRDGKKISGKLIWNISPKLNKFRCLFSSTDD